MKFTRFSCLSVAAVLLMAGCAKPALFGGSEAGGEPDVGGIQTSAMRGAPAAREAQNESRPLSELNTPDAIAAREAQAQGAKAAPAAASKQTVPAAPRPPAQPYSATAATEAALKANDPHQQNANLQKGAKVRVRSDASLRARPNSSSESVPVPAGAAPELGPQVYNAGGYWWYVTAGKESGWLLQSDILP